MNQNNEREPTGKLVVRVCAMPRDVNANGDIFGGWLLSNIDIAGVGFAQEITGQRLTTVAIESMSFAAPVHVGEFVCFYATNLGVGRTSIRVGIEAWTINHTDKKAQRRLVSDAVFTYVAINDSGRPTPIEILPVSE